MRLVFPQYCTISYFFNPRIPRILTTQGYGWRHPRHQHIRTKIVSDIKVYVNCQSECEELIPSTTRHSRARLERFSIGVWDPKKKMKRGHPFKKRQKTLPSLHYTRSGFSLKTDEKTGLTRIHLDYVELLLHTFT